MTAIIWLISHCIFLWSDKKRDRCLHKQQDPSTLCFRVGGMAEWLDGKKHFKYWVDTLSIPMRWVPMPLKVGTEPRQRTALVKSGVKLPEPLQLIPISFSVSWPFWIRNWGRVENQTRKREQASQRAKEVPIPTQRTLKPSSGSPVQGWRGLTVPWGWPGSLFLSLGCQEYGTL